MRLENNSEVVEEIRNLRREGKKSSAILHFLQELNLTLPEMMSHMREAFDLDFDDVSPIGGWFADGTGELSDDAISSLLESAIEKKCK